MLTVKELAKELHTNPRSLRVFLREKFPRHVDERGRFYEFDEPTAKAIKNLYLKHVEEQQAKEEERAWFKEQETREREEGIPQSVAKLLRKRNKR